MFKGPLAPANQSTLFTGLNLKQPRFRHRTSSGTSFDKYVASSLSTIPDNEEDEQENEPNLVGKPIVFEVKANTELELDCKRPDQNSVSLF